MAKITIELPEETIAFLKLLDSEGSAEYVLQHLASFAADGIRRPMAWERGWVSQAFQEHEYLKRAETKIRAGEMEVNELGQLEWKET